MARQRRTDQGTFAPIGDEPNEDKVTGVRLPVSIGERFRALVPVERRSDWLREAIAEKLAREEGDRKNPKVLDGC